MSLDSHSGKDDREDATDNDDVKENVHSKGMGEGDHSSVVSKLEEKFTVGNLLDSLEDAYALYSQYATCIGFSVRKAKQKYFTGGRVVRQKVFCCSREGFSDNNLDGKKSEKCTKLPAYRRQDNRCGCMAYLRIKREEDAPWVVAKFVKEHNHELVPPHGTYTLRTARNLTYHKKSVLVALHSAGIGVRRSFRFMENQAGGVEHVGFTLKDAFNYADSMKQVTRVPNGDAGALMEFFVEKSNLEHSFNWSVQMDPEGRLMNFFFRDSRCLLDYQAFGDVVCVDTTYRTNKYDMVVAPFVGINHHNQNILFGIGFLSNETIPSFEWLFGTFLKSMDGKQPQIIFTDQCQAMMTAIDKVFPDVCHRLCHWHITRNAPSHFGSLNTDKDFRAMWYRCMNGVETEAEFEELWSDMMNKYKLEQKRWFVNMYKIKRRWASVFTNHRFSCGMIATSRSEATNKSLKQTCQSTNSLFEFVKCYEQMKADWRNREVAADMVDIGNSGQIVSGNLILRKASRVLTRAAYHMLEVQMIKIIAYDISGETFNESTKLLEYKVMKMREDATDDEDENGTQKARLPSRLRTVQYDYTTNMATCSCRMWETSGILCRHILKLYNMRGVKSLPDVYILPRWRKDAKLRLFKATQPSIDDPIPDSLECLAFFNLFVKMASKVADECKDDPECRNACFSSMNELTRSMNAIMRSRRCSEAPLHDVDSNINDPKQFEDPRASKRRECGQGEFSPPKSHWSGRKNKKRCTDRSHKPFSEKIDDTIHTTNTGTFGRMDTSPLMEEPFNQEGGKQYNANDSMFEREYIQTELFFESQQSVNECVERTVDIAEIWRAALNDWTRMWRLRRS